MSKAQKNAALFLTFMKIGAFTFGGGYAMIPLIQREAAEKRGWIGEEDILEIVAIAESTPGPIAVNAATFVGYRTAGLPGAFFATLGMVLPAFLAMSFIALLFSRFRQIEAVGYAFAGIRAAVPALILKALWSMYKRVPKGAVSYLLTAAAFLLAALADPPVWLILLGCGAVGLIASLLEERRRGK